MLYNAVLASDMTHFCIKLWIFDILIFADYPKTFVKTRQVLRFEIVWNGYQASVCLVESLPLSIACGSDAYVAT